MIFVLNSNNTPITNQVWQNVVKKLSFRRSQSLPEAPEGSTKYGEQHTKVPGRSPKTCFFKKRGVLGVRYSTLGLAISANRVAIRPPHQQNSAGALRAPHPLFLPRGVLLIDLRYLLSSMSSNERLSLSLLCGQGADAIS